MRDTRTRLIESALALLREQGLDAVTLRAVGDRAGLSRTAPYRYFADKKGLLAALAGRVITDMVRSVTEEISRHPDPKDRLRAYYAGYLGYALRNPEAYRLVFTSRMHGDHPEVKSALSEAAETLHPLTRNASKATLMALLSTAHGLAEMALSGHLETKGVDPAQVIDVIVAAVSSAAPRPGGS